MAAPILDTITPATGPTRTSSELPHAALASSTPSAPRCVSSSFAAQTSTAALDPWR